jgi:hypothetical protein
MNQLTHRRRTAKLPQSNVLQFAEKAYRNLGYGPHCWVLQSELPYVVDDERVIEIAMDEFGIDRDAAVAEINPTDIVDTARAWDNEDFVTRVWDELEPVGYTTSDGAVVLDVDSAELTYAYDDEDDD